MKKIIYSLLLCFILLFTIPSVRADEEIIYKDGKELVVTNVKAMQPANQVIPDSVGYFEEVNAIRYNYVVGDTKYIVLKTNNYLPLDLYDSSCNLDPTMFGNVYVYNGYWAYDKSSNPFIICSDLHVSTEENFLVYPNESNLTFLKDTFYLNNTFGFFIKSPTEEKLIYRFYNTYKYEDSYLIDFSKSYICFFDLNYSNLPKNIKFIEFSSLYNFSSLNFYSSINGRWCYYPFILEDFDIYFYYFYEVKLSDRISNYHDLRKIEIYFNLYDEKNYIPENIINIDFLYELKYVLVYDDTWFLEGLFNDKTYSEILTPINESYYSLFGKYIYNKQWDRITDCNIENLEYFNVNDNYYRFKVVSTLEVPRQTTLKSFNIDKLIFNYKGLIYDLEYDDDFIGEGNLPDSGCSKEQKNILSQIILYLSLFFIIYLIVKLLIKYFIENKKKKD